MSSNEVDEFFKAADEVARKACEVRNWNRLNPLLKEMYSARKGQGAFCNGKKLKCSSVKDLGQALVATEFGSQRDPEILDKKFRNMRSIIEKAHGIRTGGSAALGLCHVACGRVDAFFESGMHVWDIAAGGLIVMEAGGVFLDTNGGAVDLMSRRVLCAGTNDLAQQIAKSTEIVEFERD
ncbi:hypothetical protein CAPTEDRAFT_166839 [Capitella teleta]|uniref:inositol-phosphate phosphatase n=1 Tax=Capitella teleta TaxID=283909 RepID=R7TXL6_CAPTE|nr:hypothetical protein CAPTEDRAFT_166839 [Capitella teleta]|eukprot:ELT96191.1 hypothetical protein CAPTEDRAFT_166839 [Capitella teleta]